MNYELARKLKDAGFPQGGMDCNWIHPKKEEISLGLDEIYAPTLEELINAMGDKFQMLTKADDHWRAHTDWKDENQNICHELAFGLNPWEALVNLYLITYGNSQTEKTS